MADAATSNEATVAYPAAPVTVAAIERSLLVNVARGELILVRHGQQAYPKTPLTRAEIIDPPLSAVGRRQARAVARYLRRVPAAAVYSSELERARVTAEVIAHQADADLRPIVVEGIEELDLFGELPPDTPVIELAEQAAVEAAASRFLETRRWDSFPYTESGAALRRRVTDAIDRLADAHEGEIIVVVAHGAVINAFVGAVLGVDTDMLFFPAHGSVSRFYFDDGAWVLGTLNEVAHLQARNPSLVTF